MKRNPSALLLLSGLALACLAPAGCVEREFLIQSDPPGARLWLDREDKGEMPPGGYVDKFAHYGVREVILTKSGYRSRTVLVPLHRPFYQLVPFDFIFEHLIPFKIRDVQKADPHPIALEKAGEPSRDPGPEAESFRDEARKRLAEEAMALPPKDKPLKRKRPEEVGKKPEGEIQKPEAPAPEMPDVEPPEPKKP